MEKEVDNLYTRALTYATTKHAKQQRRYTGEPYITHPIEVVGILKQFGFIGETLHAAAVLHDVVEDTDAKFQEIRDLFGETVFEYVFWLTDISHVKQGNRELRKHLDLLHLTNTPYTEVLIIKCADMISNTRSILEHDKGFAQVYIPEKAKMLNAMDGRFRHHEPIFKHACFLVRNSGIVSGLTVQN